MITMKSNENVNVYRVTSTRDNYYASFRVVAKNAMNARNVLSRDMNVFERVAFFNIESFIETKRV